MQKAIKVSRSTSGFNFYVTDEFARALCGDRIRQPIQVSVERARGDTKATIRLHAGAGNARFSELAPENVYDWRLTVRDLHLATNDSMTYAQLELFGATALPWIQDENGYIFIQLPSIENLPAPMTKTRKDKAERSPPAEVALTPLDELNQAIKRLNQVLADNDFVGFSLYRENPDGGLTQLPEKMKLVGKIIREETLG